MTKDLFFTEIISKDGIKKVWHEVDESKEASLTSVKDTSVKDAARHVMKEVDYDKTSVKEEKQK